MSNKIQIEQDFIIDKLTDSILNTISGDSFQTEVGRLTSIDLKNVTKKNRPNGDPRFWFVSGEVAPFVDKLYGVTPPSVIQPDTPAEAEARARLMCLKAASGKT